MVFKYINMPKLVAFYLREFSVNGNNEPSNLYKFIFCLCLPFVFPAFRTARLNALAIAECTNSADQIMRLLQTITGAQLTINNLNTQFTVVYDGSNDQPDFMYDGSADIVVAPYSYELNEGVLYVVLNDKMSKEQFESYVVLLQPWYVKYQIIYVDDQNSLNNLNQL